MRTDRGQPAFTVAAAAALLWTAVYVSGTGIIAPAAAAQAGIDYDVDINGATGDIDDLIAATSRLVSGRATPPLGMAGLRQRADADVEAFQSVLRSQGYFGARVDAAIDAEAQPILVDVTIVPGPLFRIGDCRISLDGGDYGFAPRDCAALGLPPETPARSNTILNGEAQLRRAFLENGYPEAVITRNAVVNHAGAMMNLQFTAAPGPLVELGDIVISGNERTEGPFLQRLQTWQPGARYDVRLIDTFRERLSGLELFDSIAIVPAAAVEAGGVERPIAVTVSERPRRSLGGGVRYATTEGLGLKGFWEHRNIFREAEILRFELGIAELAQSLSAIYSLPHRPNPEQRLDFNTGLLHEATDAYSKKGGEFSIALTTPIAASWRGRIGGGLQFAETDDGTGPQTSLIASMPVDASYDGTDTLLDPTRGERLLFRATPVGGNRDGTLLFLKLEGQASAYRRLDAAARTVVAARIKLGTVLGADADAIPPDWRFYSGGGGSIRGYDYQHIGPLDAMGDPAGGRSLVESGLEIRQRLTETWGAVAFVEAGNVGRDRASLWPSRAAAGTGIRYYTAFGPIRADVAIPLNRRAGDAEWAAYISIGQAF